MIFKNRSDSKSEDMRRFATDSIDDPRKDDGNKLTNCPARPVPMIFWMNGRPVTAARASVDGGIFW
jgi:hypothetical protein